MPPWVRVLADAIIETGMREPRALHADVSEALLLLAAFHARDCGGTRLYDIALEAAGVGHA